jgi:hypothetical protein
MGEIIKGKFGEKKEVPKKEGDDAHASYNIDMSSLLSKVVEQMSNSGGEVSIEVKMLSKAMEIENYITSLHMSPISNDVAATAEKHWKGFTTKEDLLAAAEVSKKSEWQKYPGTYLELAKRLKNFKKEV